MAKSKSPSKSTKRTSTHPGPGGNWPSTTGKTSGKSRGNARQSKSS